MGRDRYHDNSERSTPPSIAGTDPGCPNAFHADVAELPGFSFRADISPADWRAIAQNWPTVIDLTRVPPTADSIGKLTQSLNRLMHPRQLPPDAEPPDFRTLTTLRFAGYPDPVRRSIRAELLASVELDHAEAYFLPELLAGIHHEVVYDWPALKAELSNDTLNIGGYQVMQGWERPIMHAMVDRVLELSRAAGVHHPRVVEVGWGMGISGSRFLAGGVDYTVIELNREVARNAEQAIKGSRSPGRVILGDWQTTILDREAFDIAFYDAYWTTYAIDPVGLEDDLQKRIAAYVATVAGHFGPALKPGGLFTYFIRNDPSHIPVLLNSGYAEVICNQITGFQVAADTVYYAKNTDSWINVVGRK